MIRINLLPVKAAQKKEKLKGDLALVFLALIITLALCGSVYMYFDKQVQAAQAEIDQKQAEIAKLMKTIGEVNQFKKRQADLRAKLDVLETLENARSGPVYLLDELYLALPEKVWLTSFSLAGGSARIDGIGTSEEMVATFMRSLESSDYYSNVELQVTQQSMQDGNKFQKFSLVARTLAKKPETQPK